MDDNIHNFLKLDQYRRCVHLLQKKCESIQRENERIVHRMYVVKSIAKQRNKETAMLKNRLDLYNDTWRTAQPPELSLEKADLRDIIMAQSSENGPPVKGKAVKTPGAKRGRKNGSVAPKDGVVKKRRKQKSDKEKDPNAPKRPANPFFQFCQEQRSIIMDELNSDLQPGEAEPSKQELTRQLAQRWRLMDNNDKQIYVNMYENSKMKYNQDMITYKKDIDEAKKI